MSTFQAEYDDLRDQIFNAKDWKSKKDLKSLLKSKKHQNDDQLKMTEDKYNKGITFKFVAIAFVFGCMLISIGLYSHIPVLVGYGTIPFFSGLIIGLSMLSVELNFSKLFNSFRSESKFCFI